MSDIQGLRKVSGTSFQEIFDWLRDNKSQHRVTPLQDAVGNTFALERVVRLYSYMERQFVERFGSPIDTSDKGHMYRAELTLDDDPDLQRLRNAGGKGYFNLPQFGGKVRVENGKLIEETYIYYIRMGDEDTGIL